MLPPFNSRFMPSYFLPPFETFIIGLSALIRIYTVSYGTIAGTFTDVTSIFCLRWAPLFEAFLVLREAIDDSLSLYYSLWNYRRDSIAGDTSI